MDETVYVLKIDGIPGESKESKHKGEIDVLSWSWGEQASVSSGGSGGGAGKVEMGPVHVAAHTSQASPKLLLACASGQHIKEAVLTVARKTKGKRRDFLVIKLTDVLVSSYQVSGAQPESTPLDAFSLDFSKIEMDYTQIKADGSPGTLVKAGWDIKSNKPV
jgi:type VI secretion system secreted protein Hcp